MGKRDEKLTLRDAVAAGYGAHSTLRKHISAGELPASKDSRGRTVMRLPDLDAWAAVRRVKLVRSDEVDPKIKARAQKVAAEAPRLTEAQARAVATILVKGGGQ